MDVSVKKIEHLGIDDMDKITDDAKFIDLGADSLDTVEQLWLEEAFDVDT